MVDYTQSFKLIGPAASPEHMLALARRPKLPASEQGCVIEKLHNYLLSREKMGLDGVELIMAIEEKFQIVIKEDEAYNVQTPDDLTNLVFSKLRKVGSQYCSSQQSFYIVRRKIIQRFGVKRNSIKPNTKLVDLVDKKNRKKFLKEITRDLSSNDVVCLEFNKPKYLQKIRLSSSLIVFAISLYIFEYQVGLSFLIIFFYLGLFSMITEPLKNEFPDNFQTVADLVKINASLDSTIWSRQEVYDRVKEIVVEQLSVNSELILPNSHFVDDLGMD
nr:hypothetical protein [Desulfogranum japonicum]